jgi:exopolysaccharide biosynthesis polyprenyl glycosylphosphotransferase
MMDRSTRAADAGLRVLDLAALAAALPVAHEAFLSLPNAPWSPPHETFWAALVFEIVLWVGSAWLHQLYDQPGRTLGRELTRLFRCFAVVGLAMAALTFYGKVEGLSRLFTGLYFTIALLFLIANRLALRFISHAARKRGYHVRRYAVVGTGALAREIVETISAHPEWGLELAGYVVEPGGPVGREEVLGRLDDIGRVLEEHVVDEAIFALPRERMSACEREVEQAVLLCEELGVEIRISLDVLRYSGSSRMLLGDLDGLPMLSLTRTPSDTLALAVKRAFDVAVSGFVLLLMAPVLLAVAVAIRLDSPGPVFFRQRRVGVNGREFRMLKFRSMHVDAETRLEALRSQNEMSGPVFKMKNDPRVTRVGSFLRQTSLDEFPQFLNVLRGEMSVVGPRPPIRSEVQKYERWQRRRLSVRPGITCTWQISGRNNIDFERWMELDLEYIDQWSLWQDFRICLKTIPAVLAARGAH